MARQKSRKAPVMADAAPSDSYTSDIVVWNYQEG